MPTKASTVKKTAEDAVEEAREEVEKQTAALSGDIRAKVADAREVAANAGSEIAERLQHLIDHDLRHMIEEANKSLTTAAQNLRKQDLNSVARSTRDFARRNPAVVVAGLALVGYAAARFLRPDHRDEG